MAEKKKILYMVEAMGGGVFTYIVDTERVRIEESGTKTDVTRLISARMATEFERGLTEVMKPLYTCKEENVEIKYYPVKI